MSTKIKRAKMELEETNFEDDQSDDAKSDVGGNPGWADVMQKILQTKKSKRKKTIVLSKAKKLCDIKKKNEEEQLPFEIEKVKEEMKTEESEEVENDNQKPRLKKERRKEINLGIRVKPSKMDREYERKLQRITTKGIVQFFNAVKQQQDEINKKLSDAGPSERKREQVLKSIDKNTFLDILMGGSKSIPVDNDVKNETHKNEKYEKKQKKNKEIWNVLRDDFVMGTKLKDWDLKNQDEDSSAPENSDSDD